MRDWALKQGDPLYLTLAADARTCTPDYINDHIWEVDLGTGEPRALALQTTYGLRARSMRIFLRFTEDKKTVSDPATFPTPPCQSRYYPNFMRLDFTPLDNLAVNAEYWIPESHAAAGRLTLVNQSNKTRHITLEVCGLLAALDGHGLTPIQQQMVNVLAGQTSGITPVIFMTGGARHGPGPHPSLQLDMELGPGGRRVITFAQAALKEIPASFELARHTAARSWEAERARIELQNEADSLDIHTGDPDWDAALAFSQKAALGLLLRGNEHLPETTFVQARQPDHGFSHREDGSDYPPAWSGQSVLDSYHLASVLSATPQVIRSLLSNYLAVQTVDGDVDNKPGLGGQRGKLLASPMLASLAWEYFTVSEDESFLHEARPKLMDFFRTWFGRTHDRDQNGIPEWDHLLQTGFEENPLFDVWHPWSQGLDISTVQSPSLAGMLYREAQSLIHITRQVSQSEPEPALVSNDRQDGQAGPFSEEIGWLETQAGRLKEAVEQSWSENSFLYTYRDRETGLTQPGGVITKGSGNGELRPRAEFEQPVRLLIEVLTDSASTTRPVIEISEFSSKGKIEVLEGLSFQWRTGGLVATSSKTYSRVGLVTVKGLDKEDRIFIRKANTRGRDLTQALPLWAGLPDAQRAQQMIQKTLMDEEGFACPFGLSALPTHPDASTTTTRPGFRGARSAKALEEAEAIAVSVHLPLNAMLGEGMLAYGARREAAALVTRLMKAVIQNLKAAHGFHQRYHARSGTGIGERNAVQGMAPTGLFLRTLGVRIHSAVRVRLEGKNPFPWPVTINYKGLTVLRGLDRTMITFPNGRNVMVDDPTPCVVSQ